MIEVRGLVKGYRPGVVLNGIDIDVARGELVVLLGPSGCGKTTLLRLIAGLSTLDDGQIRIAGRILSDGCGAHFPPRRRGVGMVFQDLALWPHLRALENVSFGLGRDHVGGGSARQRALGAMELMGIAELAERRPHQLSGGQRQRLALARALAPGHSVLLLDEPFSNLDPLIKLSLLDALRRIRDRADTAVLYVTHGLDEALAVAHRIVMLNNGVIRASLGGAEIGAMSLENLTQWYRCSVAS